MKKILVFTAALLLFVGCGKLNKENYDKVSVGMDYDKVVEVLGKPDKCEEAIGIKNCVWGDEAKNIKIGFIADKATAKSSKDIK